MAGRRRLLAKPKVFVSHSSVDAWVARQISWHLKRAGAATFLDEADIETGDDFEEHILQEMDGCSELLVLLTPWSLKRPYIWLEIGAAWGQRKRIVGILYGVTISDLEKNGRPALLKKVTLRKMSELEQYFRELNGRIKKAKVKHAT